MAKALTIPEVAERLSVHVKTVYNLLERGDLRGFKVGRVWRVSEENLAAFIERNGRNDEDEEELSAEDLAAVRRGLEDLKAGRFVTLEEYEQGRRP